MQYTYGFFLHLERQTRGAKRNAYFNKTQQNQTSMVIKNRDGEDMGTCHAQAKEEPPRKKNTYYPQKNKGRRTHMGRAQLNPLVGMKSGRGFKRSQ